MSGTLLQTSLPIPQPSVNKSEAIKVCAICLQKFNLLDNNFAKCKSCGLIAENLCIHSFIKNVELNENWNCPKCLYIQKTKKNTEIKQENKDEKIDNPIICELCAYSGGFLCPLKKNEEDKENYEFWVHPFCCCFHKEVQKSSESDLFIWHDTRESKNEKQSTKKVAKKIKEKNLKETNKNLPPCIYCQRAAGHKKQCTRCHKFLLHPLCAYKANAVFVESGELSNIGGNLNVDAILCPTCIENQTKAPNSTPEKAEKTENSENLRKSTRIRESKARKALMPDPESESTPEKTEEKPILSESEKKPVKRHTQLVMGSASKTRNEFKPKATEILKGLTDFILEADLLQVFKREYSDLPVYLDDKEIEVFFYYI